jgi:hypothetical protein
VISKSSVWLHAGLFIVASALSLRAITKTDDTPGAEHETPLWSESADAVKRIELTSKTKSVVLEGQADGLGRYFVGTIDREKAKPPKNPHAPPSEADAGAPPAAPESVERETVRFVAVKDALELAQSIGKLTAKRSLGKLTPDRFEEFGFEPDAPTTVRFDVAGTVHEFVVGGKTPGGGDVYVRDTKTSDGYVIAGGITRDLESADSTLMQRNFLDLDSAEVAKAILRIGGAQRELVPVTDQSQFWANPADPSAKDETASNWMTKFSRLRVSEYVEKVDGETTPIAEVEYFGKDGKSLGKVQLMSQTLPGEDKPRYLAKSATTRWVATVLASTGEQLAQDAQSVAQP